MELWNSRELSPSIPYVIKKPLNSKQLRRGHGKGSKSWTANFTGEGKNSDYNDIAYTNVIIIL